MIPWSLLDTAQIPGGAELRLMRRGREFSIMLGQNELMNSRVSGSEEMLAAIVCERIKGRERPALLIGGLGMGFTLRAALDGLGRDAVVVVAEIVPGVLVWARGELRELFGDSLTDARVTIHQRDVGDLIRPNRSTFDAILLDVDNGPQGLVREANDSLYSAQGLNAAHAALRPGGVLAVWSTAPDAGFTQRLRKIGFDVEERYARASRTRSGARRVIWIATRVMQS